MKRFASILVWIGVVCGVSMAQVLGENFCTSSNGVTLFVLSGGCLNSSYTSFTATENPDGTVDIVLVKGPNTNANSFNGAVRTSRAINNVEIRNTSTNTMLVRIGGANADIQNSPQFIRNIFRTGNGPVIAVPSLQCRGDVGSIAVNNLSNAEILGDITGDIALLDVPATGNLEGIWSGNNIIDGDVLGDVFLAAGFQAGARIEVLGRFGGTGVIAFMNFGGFFDGELIVGESNARMFMNDFSGLFKTTSANGESGNMNDILVISNDAAGGRIEIGGSFGGPGAANPRFDFGLTDGARCPVVINFDQIGGAWNGEVRLGTAGTFSVLPPEYCLPSTTTRRPRSATARSVSCLS